MSKGPENTVEYVIRGGLNKAGWSTDHCESTNQDGWPDITAFRGVYSLLIEVKKETAIRASQLRFATQMWKRHRVIVWSVRHRNGAFVVQPVYSLIEVKPVSFLFLDGLIKHLTNIVTLYHEIAPVGENLELSESVE